MVRQHHWLNGHEFEQTLGDSEGQGSLVCCSPWDAELDMTEQLNNNMRILFIEIFSNFKLDAKLQKRYKVIYLWLVSNSVHLKGKEWGHLHSLSPSPSSWDSSASPLWWPHRGLLLQIQFLSPSIIITRSKQLSANIIYHLKTTVATCHSEWIYLSVPVAGVVIFWISATLVHPFRGRGRLLVSARSNGNLQQWFSSIVYCRILFCFFLRKDNKDECTCFLFLLQGLIKCQLKDGQETALVKSNKHK